MKKRYVSLLMIAALIFNLAAVDLSFSATKGWVRNSKGEKTAYILSNGERATGHQIISGRGYVFDKDGDMLLGYQQVDGKPYYIRNRDGMSSAKGWITFKSGKKSYNRGYGELLTGIWRVKGQPYGFNLAGYLAKGKLLVKGKPYYFDRYGRPAGKGWIRNSEGGKVYFCTGDGKLATGKWKISDRAYLFDSSGRILSGMHKLNGKPYYFNGTAGSGPEKKWITFKSGRKVYTRGYGELLTGIWKIKGTAYGFNSSGYLAKGRLIVNGKPYYLSSSGRPVSRGWIYDSNGEHLYYSQGDGKLATGLVDIDDRTYLFNDEGEILTGKWRVDGLPYYFKDKNGMGPEREWITLSSGRKVYAAGYGNLLTGVNIIDGEVYGFDKDGFTLSGKQVIDGVPHYFEEDGKAWPKGWIDDEEGNHIYFSRGDGRLVTGKYIIGGNVHHFDKEGHPYGYCVKNDGVNYFYHMDGTPYGKGWVRNDEGRGYMYCKGNGVLATGYNIINDRACFFDETGDMKFGHIRIKGKPYYFSEAKRGESKTPGWTHLKNGNSRYSKGYGELATGKYTIDGTVYHFNEDGYIRLKRRGIDVSTFQGKIDWAGVKSDGIEFAFIRTGGRFGGSGKFYDDDRYEYNMKNAIANGIDTGVYFFTQAINTKEAVEEAQYTCKRLKGYDIKYPVVIDTEYLADSRHSEISVKQRTAVVKAFCEEVKRQGYEPMVYANLNWLNKHLNMKELKAYKVWVAQYYDECQYKGDYDCWQYTSSGHVKGIDGRVDRNYWYEGDLKK